MKRNKIFFEILPSLKINPTTAYVVFSWLKWSWSWAMRVNKFNNWLLKVTDLHKEMTEEEKIENYCWKYCKGYQQTGKCYVDGKCEAFRNHYTKIV